VNIFKDKLSRNLSLNNENKITLTWENLNVHVPENNSIIAKIFKKKKSDQRSHIVQNGKIAIQNHFIFIEMNNKIIISFK